MSCKGDLILHMDTIIEAGVGLIYIICRLAISVNLRKYFSLATN